MNKEKEKKEAYDEYVRFLKRGIDFYKSTWHPDYAAMNQERRLLAKSEDNRAYISNIQRGNNTHQVQNFDLEERIEGLTKEKHQLEEQVRELKRRHEKL